MADPETMRRLRLIEQRLARLETKPPLTYVEAPYTPTYFGGTTVGVTTYTTQAGWYIQIGGLVVFWGRVVWTAATGTGNANISLPLTVGTAASGTYRWAGSLRTDNLTIGAFSPQMLITAGASAFTMFIPANNAAGANIAVEAAGDVIFSGFYTVATI